MRISPKRSTDLHSNPPVLFGGIALFFSHMAPAAATQRAILASLFVHGELDKATLIGAHRRTVDLELPPDDHLPTEQTFDTAREWLVTNELVRWTPAPRGKRWVMSLGPAWGYGIGVVLGYRSLRCGIGDPRAAPLILGGEAMAESTSVPALDETNAKSTVRAAAAAVVELLARAELEPQKARGVTLAVPAPVDLEGNLASGRILADFEKGPGPRELFGEALEELGVSGLQIDLDNDANVLAVGEWHFRRASRRTAPLLLVVKVSGGIGGALVDARGELHRGATGTAGELGHVPVDVTELPPHDIDLPMMDPEAVCQRCGGTGHLEFTLPHPQSSTECFPAMARWRGPTVIRGCWPPYKTLATRNTSAPRRPSSTGHGSSAGR